MPQGDKCWKDWAVQLRMTLIHQKTTQVTKTVEEVFDEVGTDEPFGNLQSHGFWNAVRNHIKDWDTLHEAGFEVDFERNAVGRVEQVTFQLDESWRSLLEGR